jgi:hypothetical protein
MKNTKFTVGFFGSCSLVLAGALFSGCAPMTKTSKYMAASLSAPTAPPAGKALVCIHRPKAGMGWKLYTAIWVDTKFVADLGNRHSVAYVCEPGRHYFMNTSVEEQACIEAELLPDQTYDFWAQSGYGFWIASFKLKPLHQDAKTRQLVAKWTQQNRWVERTAPAAAYEQTKQDQIRQLLEEFISGKRHDKLQHLAAEDHR